MRAAKAVGLVLVGVLVGVGITSVHSALRAQTTPQNQPAARVTGVTAQRMMVDGRPWDATPMFLKDAISGGCWLYIHQSAPSGPGTSTINHSLAVAPPSACQ
jgi:hypothetical protein